jgi:ATP-dependent Clp protease protease subunit
MKRLYWIGQINDELYTSFTKELYDLERKPSIKEISLEVASEGGSSDVGLALYGRMLSSRIKFKAYGFGLVHSAAVLGFLACSERVCTPECTFLIHNSRGKVKGDYRDIKRAGEKFESDEEMWAKLVSSHTLMTIDYVREFSDKETYLTATEALDLGIVHSIIGQRGSDNAT